jgi:hypothetical protein
VDKKNANTKAHQMTIFTVKKSVEVLD